MVTNTESSRRQALIQFMIGMGILLAINVAGQYLYTHFDLTEEKRFTLTKPTIKQLEGLKDVVHVEVLLDGKFPAGFKRLQNATRELLQEFHDINPAIDFSFRNPLQGKPDEVKAEQEKLSKIGINPVNLRVVDDEAKTESLIYPYAILHYSNREVAVNMLESETPNMPKEIILNNSVGLLEFKFSNAIQKLLSNKKPLIGFLTGHNELPPPFTVDLRKSLKQFYEMGPVHLDSLASIPVDKISVVMINKPMKAFSDRDLFLLDQYVMNGGKTIWLIDKLTASLDNMADSKKYVPIEIPINLDDFFFRNGIRIQNDAVLDIECGQIPLAVGQQGGKPQFELFRWPYFPVPTGRIPHPIVKNLDRVWFQFPSSIDTLKTKTDIKKTVLLTSSKYSRLQFSPIELDLNIASIEPDPKLYSKQYVPLAVLLEGQFSSMFENRVTEQMQATLKEINQPFVAISTKPGKMLVVSDGDLARNDFNPQDESYSPLGFSKYDRYNYANKDFLLNAIEYMLDDAGVIEARSKDIRLRLLDPGKVKEQKTTWQFINLFVPLVMVGLFAALMLWIRKRRYAR
jgi:ABC-2 type transport system permease protein